MSMSEKFSALPGESPAWSDPEKEGWLNKRGHIVKNWKKRWFRLKNGSLYYFKEKQDGAPKGEIRLKGYTVEAASGPETTGKDFCFALRSVKPGPGKTATATDTRDGRKVVVSRRELKYAPLKQTVAELSKLRGLSHGNLAAVFDVFALGTKEVAVVSEYLEGCSLFVVIGQHGHSKQLSEPQMAYVCREALKALACLHSAFLIHRDLKSERVALLPDGSVKLTGFEFGMTANESGDPKPSNITGSPYWIAPEVVQSEAYTTKADIWSLGILLLEMAQGAPPYIEMAPLQALHEVFSKGLPALEAQPPRISQDLVEFLAQCTAPVASRPDAQALSEHAFLKHACKQGEVAELVRQHMAETATN
eukprot:m51a1_g8161 putative p21-activated protein kinase (363) ;mRNA; f:67447-69230